MKLRSNEKYSAANLGSPAGESGKEEGEANGSKIVTAAQEKL